MGFEYTPPPNVAAVASKVKAPAIALIIVSGLNILSLLVGLALQVIGVGMGTQIPPGAPPEAERLIQLLSGGIGILIYVFGIAVSAFVLFASFRMMNFQGWGMALAASILAITCLMPWPCFCCLPLGMPFGIWSIVVLSSADVKAAFR